VIFLVIVASVATWAGTEMCNYQPALRYCATHSGGYGYLPQFICDTASYLAQRVLPCSPSIHTQWNAVIVLSGVPTHLLWYKLLAGCRG